LRTITELGRALVSRPIGAITVRATLRAVEAWSARRRSARSILRTPRRTKRAPPALVAWRHRTIAVGTTLGAVKPWSTR